MWFLDISSTFTYGELNEVIYMEELKEYHQKRLNIVYRLHKLLYSLK